MFSTASRPSPGAIANRRLLILIVSAVGILTFTVGFLRHGGPTSYAHTPIHHVAVADETLKGEPIMPKLGNETLK
jgi:hypothetical protein